MNDRNKSNENQTHTFPVGEPGLRKLVDLGRAVVRVKRVRYVPNIWTTVQFIVPPDDAHSEPQAFAEICFSEAQLKEFIAALTIGSEPVTALDKSHG